MSHLFYNLTLKHQSFSPDVQILLTNSSTIYGLNIILADSEVEKVV